MHDDEIKAPTSEQHQKSRVLWFLQCAVNVTGVVMDRGDLNRLANEFNTAMRADGALLLWEPRFEDTVPRPEGMRP